MSPPTPPHATPPGAPHRIVFGLGSNLGDCRTQLRTAARQLVRAAALQQPRRSRIYLSEAVGPPQPVYLNAAVAGVTHHTLPQLLAIALRIERALGRVRTIRWGARSIDIDLLWSSARVIHDDTLTVPHPGLLLRPFALQPLLEVAPKARIPGSHKLYAHHPCASARISVAEPL